ncbi:MAG: formate dehydrogenase accessory sulfurtransferase FdhD [Oscillatoriaceae cyanobacterium]
MKSGSKNQAGKGKSPAKVWVVDGGDGEDGRISHHQVRADVVAVEEPLEIRIMEPRKTLAVTMRTPGADFDLVAGFLLTEGVVRGREDIGGMSYCVDREIDGEQRQNIVNVRLNGDLPVDWGGLDRHFFTNSACGVCGKASLEALQRRIAPIDTDMVVAPEVIYSLPERLAQGQGLFRVTGGLHGAALFDAAGNLLQLREDVGRHNALDKLIGASLLAEELPWHHRMVMVSGRSSFEILQKCAVAGVAIVCAVSAPSSLAVSLAEEFGITLIGFLRGNRFNVYSGIERIRL